MLTLDDLIALTWQKRKIISETQRISQFKEFRYLYENDYEMIKEIIKSTFVNRPFSEESLKGMVIQHQDVLSKILNRKTSGIIGNNLGIEYLVGDKPDENFKELAAQTGLNNKIKECLRRMEFFNTSIAHTIYRDGEIDIDIITGDEASVLTKTNFLKLKAIKLERVNEEGEIYYSIWTEDKHFIQFSEGDPVQPNENNPDMEMPYSNLPFSILRKNEGMDFWGEPNWGLFFYSLLNDLSRSDDDLAEFFQKWSTFYAINMNLPEDFRLSPRTFIGRNKVNTNEAKPEIGYINANINWESLISNRNYKAKYTYVNEGLSANSASLETLSQSGISKMMDESELEEYREELKPRLSRFIKSVGQNLIMTHNYHVSSGDIKDIKAIPEDGVIRIEFGEQSTIETISDIKARREMEMEFGERNQIDFIMEDFNFDNREDAIQHFEKIKEENNKYGLSPAPKQDNSLKTKLGITQ